MEHYKLSTEEDCNGNTRGCLSVSPEGEWVKRKDLDELHKLIDKLKREATIRKIELRGSASDLGLDPEASVDQIREQVILQRDRAQINSSSVLPMTHVLKTDPMVFQDTLDGIKTFEVRRDDRNFQPGDELELHETLFSAAEMGLGSPLEYTGRTCRLVVTYKLAGGYGLLDGFCVLAVKRVSM